MKNKKIIITIFISILIIGSLMLYLYSMILRYDQKVLENFIATQNITAGSLYDNVFEQINFNNTDRLVFVDYSTNSIKLVNESFNSMFLVEKSMNLNTLLDGYLALDTELKDGKDLYLVSGLFENDEVKKTKLSVFYDFTSRLTYSRYEELLVTKGTGFIFDTVAFPEKEYEYLVDSQTESNGYVSDYTQSIFLGGFEYYFPEIKNAEKYFNESYAKSFNHPYMRFPKYYFVNNLIISSEELYSVPNSYDFEGKEYVIPRPLNITGVNTSHLWIYQSKKNLLVVNIIGDKITVKRKIPEAEFGGIYHSSKSINILIQKNGQIRYEVI